MPASKLLGACVLLLASLSLARTEPTPTTPVVPLQHSPGDRPTAPAPSQSLAELLWFIGDERLQAELKLTPEQVKKLLALRQKNWDASYTTPATIRLPKRDEAGAATTAAMKEILTPEQVTRAGQLVRQHAWQPTGNQKPFAKTHELDMTGVRSELLRQDSELATALKLSENQQKLVAGEKTIGGRSISTQHRILLTAEQTEIARKLLGRIVKTDWMAARDPRMDRVQFFGYSDEYTLRRIASSSKYRTELKLTDEQVAKIGPPATLSTSRRWNPDISPEEALKKAQDADSADEQALAKILTAEQMTRVRQLTLRELRDPALRNWPEPLILGLADELLITPAQQQKVGILQNVHAKALAQAALTADYADARKGIRAANAEFEKSLAETLTDAQRAKLKLLVGDPLPTKPNRSGLLTDTARQKREESFGQYTNELTLLNANKSIQAELKLTPDQLDFTKKTVQEMNKRFGFGFGKAKKMPELTPAEQAAAKSKYIGESLPAILDAQQAKRFRQIMIQHREYPESRPTTAMTTGLTYPGVAEELKLNAEQKKQIIDGEAPVDVLTSAQRKAFREMLGERFTGDFQITRTPPQPTEMPRDFADRARAVFLPEAPLQALGLKAEQQTQLAAAVTRFQLDAPDFRAHFKGTTARTIPFGKTTPARDTTGPAIRNLRAQLLATAQVGNFLPRLDELLYQSCAAHNLRDTLNHADVIAELRLTPAQLFQIADLEDETAEIAQLVSRSSLTVDSRDDILKRLRDRLDARMFAVLTPEQTAKWKTMTGKPYPEFVKTVIRGPIYRPSR